MFYKSVPERREALIAGWEQFEKDLAAHEPQAKTEKVVAEEVKDLPAISYKMNGLSLVSNLEEFKAQSDALVELSKKPLETDQDFANAESRQKVFTKAEADIKALADRVLGEVADIDAFTKDLRYIGEQIRQARLAEGKQIKERKEQLRYEIANKASEQVRVFIEPLTSELKLNFGFQNQIIVDAMKGKRTIESLQDAADSAVAQIKIDITEQANTARANLATLKEHASDYKFLFNDWSAIAFKACEDFTALVKMRIAEHKEAEEKRLNAERERIRAEEKAKAEREAREAQERAEREAYKESVAEEIIDHVSQMQPKPEYEEDLTPSNWMEAQVKHAQKVHAENTPTLTDYQRGYLDGMKAYSWLKNGVEYVGTGGQTYEAAADLFIKRGKAA
jgi:hypothetical protein